MTFDKQNKNNRIKAFSKLCAIVKSCKTLPQLTITKNFIISSTKRCGLSDKMYEHLQDKLNQQAQLITKGIQ